MDFVQPMISVFCRFSFKRRTLTAVFAIFLILQNNLHSQCLTKTTGLWTSPGFELFIADLEDISVMVQTTTPGFSIIDNVSTSTTLTSLDPSWYSEPVAGNPSLQMKMVWDLINEPQLEDIDDFADDKETGTIKFTFSEPVSCVTLHLDRIGGAGSAGGSIGVSNSVEWTVITPGITLQKPPGTGTDGFIVTSTKFFKEPDLPNTNAAPATAGLASQGATTGAAAGSVKLVSSSPITIVEFEWTGIGVEGVGADELEIAITAKPDCVPVAEIEKSIEDVKVQPDGSFEIDYLYSIQNTGDTTLSHISLIDDLRTNLGCAFLNIADLPTVQMTNTSGMSLRPSLNQNYNGTTQTDIFISTDGELHAGDELSVELTAILNPDCIGVQTPLTNEAVLSGQDPFGIIIQGQDDVDLYLPRLELTKQADTSAFSSPVAPGDVITYVFEVCNTGNGGVSNIQVLDPLPDITIFSFPLSLSPGQCNNTAFSGLYTLTPQDIINGQVSNQARVRGLSEDNEFISDDSDDPLDLTNIDPDLDGDPDDPTIVTINPVSALSFKKIANTSEVQNPTRIDDPILYSFEICNTGSVELLEVFVTDPLITVSGQAINILPGDCNTSTFSGVYLINQSDINSGEIINTATVDASSVIGDMVTDSSTVEVILNMAPQIELTKNANSSNIQNPTAAGDRVEYSFKVCNTGNVQLNNVIVDDPLISISPIPISLEIGECDETSFSGTYVINSINIGSGRVINSAIASAQSPSGIVVMDTSDDGRGELGGEDDPTIVELFACTIELGELSALQDECIEPDETINLVSSVVQSSIFPPDFELFYLLTEGQEKTIIGLNNSPEFEVQSPGQYTIHTLIAETSNPASSSYLNPALIILEATMLNDLSDFIINSEICAFIDLVGVSSLVSLQPEVELVTSMTICNSDELLMPTSITLTDLFESDPVGGTWFESSLGIIDVDSIEFIGFQAGEYVLQFTSTNAIDPCVNVMRSTLIRVVDCFNECEELVCNETLQVSLGEDCVLVPSADQLLETPATGLYTVEYSYDTGRPYGIDTLRSDAVGQVLTYTISCAGNSCWGTIEVVGNNIPSIDSPCECTGQSDPIPSCILWCQSEEQIASIIVSPEEALTQFTECGPEVLGGVNVSTQVTGELCDSAGEQHVVTYSVKVIREGKISEFEILCQTYWVQKFDLSVSETEFNAGFGFPGDVAVDCDYLDDFPDDQDKPEIGSPASIIWSTSEDSLAYPYYINKHVLIQDSTNVIDTQYVEVGEQLLDTLVINEAGEWEIITVSRKQFDTIIAEVKIPNGLAVNPIVAIQSRLCNLLTSFSDVEFETCGSGRKIVRTWTMVDWCDSEISHSANQTIEISDFSPPQIVRRQGDELVVINSLPEVQIGIDPWTCSASFRLPELDVLDNCASEPRVVWSTDEGKINDDFATDLWLEQSPVSLTAYVIDDCDNIAELELVVNIVDDIAPVIQAEQQLLVTLSYGNPGFNLGEAKIFAEDLDEGSHDNGCGEISLKTVRVDDWEEVVMNCDGEIVGFSRESSAAVFEILDLGVLTEKNSCLYDSTNLRDVVTAPQDFVRFNCDDVGLAIDVILFAMDKAGNQSQTIVSVIVDEESVPSLVCEDIDFTCDDLEDEDEFEYEPPRIVGAACFNFFLQAEIASERRVEGACGAARIVVEWFLDVDRSGDPTFGDPFCTQFVEIETEGQVLKPETIKWPPHRTGETYEGLNIECDSVGSSFEIPQTITLSDPLTCVPEISPTEGPVWCDSDCGVVGTSVETDTLFTDDSCMKLVRRWTVIDWCVWDPNSSGQNDDGNDRFVAVEDWTIEDCSTCIEFGPYDSEPVYFRYKLKEESTGIVFNKYEVDLDGYYTFDQIIKVVDNEAPIINSPDTIVVEVDITGVEQDSFGVCFGRGIISVEGNDMCNLDNTNSALDWSVEVKNEIGEIVSDLIINDPLLGPSASSGLGSPGDVHHVIWQASDGCGNVAIDTTVVLFRDLTPPTGLCISALTTTLHSDTKTIVWASEFNQSSYDNCTPPEDLLLSVRKSGEDPYQPDDDNFEFTTSLEFLCEDAGTIVDVDVWVWDLAGNGGLCKSSITIQDSSEDCNIEGPSDFRIEGSVLTEYGIPISQTSLQLVADLREYPKQTNSTVTGNYAFLSNPENHNYQLTASRDDDFINGLSTLDLVLIQRHILGLQDLDSPYKIIASDANDDHSITARDILEFRKIILGVTTELDSNLPWRFIEESASFIDPGTPWPFSEFIDINSLDRHMLNNHFVGIKVGDVNEDVILDNAISTENRNLDVLGIHVENQTVTKGQVFTIPIKNPQDQDDIYGIQFTLSHPGLVLTNIESGDWIIDESSFARFNEQTTFSWHNSEGSSAKDPLFYLTFQANETLELQSRLKLTDGLTRSEIYLGSEYVIKRIELRYSTAAVSNQIILGQNRPNPFNDVSHIPYVIPFDSNIRFSFYDVLGHMILEKSFFQTKGSHVFRIELDELKQDGLIFYKMQVNDHLKTGRMSILK